MGAMELVTLGCVIFLAYANGANDNFKGVATLYGSRTASYRTALIWTSVATAVGVAMALYLSRELVVVFKGKGLVPDEVIALREFPIAVGLGGALTVMLATVLGLPVSTTHALVGALAGAGLVAASGGVQGGQLANKFFLPLIAGPMLSLGLAWVLYPLFNRARKKMHVAPETCLCVGNKVVARVPERVSSVQQAAALSAQGLAVPQLTVGDVTHCKPSYGGTVIGISAGVLLDTLHFLSGALVSLARGLNDAPKIAALLLIGNLFPLPVSLAAIGVAMVLGGLVHSRKIAETMGDKMTEMNPGQAFTANLVTGIMVFGASRIGVPVSTTHVSCGSIMGIGAVTGKAHWRVIGQILLAWVTTLPLGLALGAGVMWALG